MLGNSRLGQIEAFPDFFYITGLRQEPTDNLQPHRMPQHFENFSFAVVILLFVKGKIFHEVPCIRQITEYMNNIEGADEGQGFSATVFFALIS